MSRAANLGGHINRRPYIRDRVQAVIATMPQPFPLAAVVDRTGLPKYICNRVLTRLVRSGELQRFKLLKTYPQWSKVRREFIPGARQRRVYFYRQAGGPR